MKKLITISERNIKKFEAQLIDVQAKAKKALALEKQRGKEAIKKAKTEKGKQSAKAKSEARIEAIKVNAKVKTDKLKATIKDIKQAYKQQQKEALKIKKRKEKEYKAISAIRELKSRGEKISYRAVEKESGLPKSWLNTNDIVRDAMNTYVKPRRKAIIVANGQKISVKEQDKYNKLQKSVNKKIQEELNALTPEAKKYAEEVDGLTKQYSVPIEKLYSKQVYRDRVKYFKELLDKDSILKYRDEQNIEHFRNVYGKSKYAEVAGKEYKDFMDELEKADAVTRYEFFADEIENLRRNYEDANEDSSTYNPKTLRDNLKLMTKKLKEIAENSPYESVVKLIRDK